MSVYIARTLDSRREAFSGWDRSCLRLSLARRCHSLQEATVHASYSKGGFAPSSHLSGRQTCAFQQSHYKLEVNYLLNTDQRVHTFLFFLARIYGARDAAAAVQCPPSCSCWSGCRNSAQE